MAIITLTNNADAEKTFNGTGIGTTPVAQDGDVVYLTGNVGALLPQQVVGRSARASRYTATLQGQMAPIQVRQSWPTATPILFLFSIHRHEI
jgi:hypothetical protein